MMYDRTPHVPHIIMIMVCGLIATLFAIMVRQIIAITLPSSLSYPCLQQHREYHYPSLFGDVGTGGVAGCAVVWIAAARGTTIHLHG